MAYVEPTTVLAPKESVRSVDVLYSTGDGGWSVARVEWEGEWRTGIRWNGAEGGRGLGHPQARGHATWFILPEELDEVVLGKIEEMSFSGPGGLVEGYRQMAQDQDREREAQEWSEGLIGDASSQG
jgi:hypothetical protein